MADKYEVSVGVTKTVEAHSENEAMNFFIDWLWSVKKEHIDCIKKEK